VSLATIKLANGDIVRDVLDQLAHQSTSKLAHIPETPSGPFKHQHRPTSRENGFAVEEKEATRDLLSGIWRIKKPAGASLTPGAILTETAAPVVS
jgi:hypothetical protein